MCELLKYLIFLLILTSCKIPFQAKKAKHQNLQYHFTKQYLEMEITPTSMDTLLGFLDSKILKYIIEYPETQHRNLRMIKKYAMHCTDEIVETNYVTQTITLESPHKLVYYSNELDWSEYKNYYYFKIHPVTKGVTKNTFCIVTASGHDVENTGEEWGQLSLLHMKPDGTFELEKDIDGWLKWF